MPDEKFTQVPNYIIDGMATMHGSTFAVVMWVARQTAGWQKEWDRISTSQFQQSTGLSRQGVLTAIADAVDRGWIEQRRIGQQAWEYKLTGKTGRPVEKKKPATGQLSRPVNSLDQSTHLTRTSQLSRPELVNSVDPQNIKKEQQRNGDIATVNTGEGGGSSFSPDDPPLDKKVAVVATAVEANGFGTLTPLMSEEIAEMAKEYPLSWIGDAFRVAVRANKRKLSYVSGVLNNWKRDGYDPKAQIVQSNGQPVTVDIAM